MKFSKCASLYTAVLGLLFAFAGPVHAAALIRTQAPCDSVLARLSQVAALRRFLSARFNLTLRGRGWPQ